MITKVIFVLALIMPNGEYITKSSVVDTCPSIKQVGDHYQQLIRDGEILDWNAAYQWQAHLQPARENGLSEKVIIALGEDTTPIFHSSNEELVYSFTRELNLTRAVSDDLYARTFAGLGPDATVDLVGVLGYYTLISMTIKAFDVLPPAGA